MEGPGRQGAALGPSAFEWTEGSRCRKSSRANTAVPGPFGLAVVFVFLLLAALYESWLLPLAVILIVPMCVAGGQ